jgi:putative pyruvate formate lyase activating enzyme
MSQLLNNELSPDNLSSLYSSCKLCPRKCGVDRTADKAGFCSESHRIRIASACLHCGEEPVLTGDNGSGTVFFSGCTLKCGFCQNCQISSGGIGAEVSEETLAGIFLRLEREGAANINLVTGTHFIPGIIRAIIRARKNGLNIPTLWNSSGYEDEQSIALLDPYIDIWIPDIKTLQPKLAGRLLKRRGYPDVVKKAVFAMKKNRKIKIENGSMKQGVVIRHLVIPGEIDSTKQVLEWFKNNLSSDALLSVMFQYIPIVFSEKERKMYPHQYVSEKEAGTVLKILDDLEIEEGFVQDPSDANTWIPDFTKENPFPPDFAQPVWHYSRGFM